MPLDLKTIKSAEAFTDESKIIDLIKRSDDTYRARKPLQAGADPGQTEVIMAGGRPLVSKRSDMGLITVATMPEVDALKALAKDRGFEWNDGDENRVVRYWASDARGDRHGDVVDQSWDMSEYQDNAVMLLSHDWEQPPIGGVLDWDVVDRQTRNYTGEALSLLSLFASEDVSPRADAIFRLVKAGFMKAGSVGFFPTTVIEVKDKQERRELGLADWGLLFANNKLIEWSPCSVPANPGAHRDLKALKGAGSLRANDIQTLREMKRIELTMRGDPDRFKREDALLVGTWKLLYPDVRVPEHKDAGEPIVEEVLDRDSLVSMKDIGDMLESIQTGVNDRLQQVEGKLDDLLFELREGGATKAADDDSDDDSDTVEEIDVLGAAAKMLAEK